MSEKPLYEILSRCTGAQLKGLRYEPLFPYFKSEEKNGAFQVCTDTYVTDDTGTGVVHQVPFAFHPSFICFYHSQAQQICFHYLMHHHCLFSPPFFFCKNMFIICIFLQLDDSTLPNK